MSPSEIIDLGVPTWLDVKTTSGAEDGPGNEFQNKTDFATNQHTLWKNTTNGTHYLFGNDKQDDRCW